MNYPKGIRRQYSEEFLTNVVERVFVYLTIFKLFANLPPFNKLQNII